MIWNARLDMVRWPEREAVDDWSQGVPLAALQDYVSYWRNGYDWRKVRGLAQQDGAVHHHDRRAGYPLPACPFAA